MKTSSVYRHDTIIPHTSTYLYEPVLGCLRDSGVRSVLDLGCGNGSFSQFLLSHGFDVVGMEPSEEGVAVFREKNPTIPCYQLSTDDDPEAIAETDFDAVVSLEVVEHLYLPRKLPGFAGKKLKEKGLLVVSTPYHGYLKNLSLSLFDKWDTHLDPFWDGGHIKFWSKKTLRRLFEEGGFDNLCFQGVGRLPYLWKSIVVSGHKK